MNKPTKSDTTWEAEYAKSLGLQAYVYGFPWVYLSWLKWLWSTPSGKAAQKKNKVTLPWAPINQFFHSSSLATSANQTGGAPNCELLYSIACLDLSGGPVILEVPKINDRYFCFQMLSIDSDNFGYAGGYATGSAAAKFLIAGPGWEGSVPDDVLDVIPRSRTDSAFIFGRTGVNNTTETEVETAYEISKLYTLTPLCKPVLGETPSEIRFQDNPTENSENAFTMMNAAMLEDPPGQLPGIDQTELLNLFATVGIGPDQNLDEQSPGTVAGLSIAQSRGLEILHGMSKGRGHITPTMWTYPPRNIGRAGQNSDFITRAAVQCLAGISAHDAQEAVYINTSVDSQGVPLSGQNIYELDFDLDHSFPPCIKDPFFGYWSLTLYDSTYNLVANSTNYNFNSIFPDFIKYIQHGNRLKVVLSTTEPEEAKDPSNGVYWLQSPLQGDFFVILRVYVPGPEIWNTQTWNPPAILRTNT